MLRPRRRWRTTDEIAPWVIASAICHQLIDKLLGVRGQQSLRIPRYAEPLPDRPSSLHQWQGANAIRNDDRRGNDRNAIPDLGQSDECMRCGALQKHAWSDVRDIAGGVEPFARTKAAVEQEQGFLAQLGHIERAPTSKPMPPRQHCQIENGEEEAMRESIVGYAQGQLHFALLEPAGQTQASIFYKMHLHTGMAKLVLAQKARERVLDHHRCRSDSQYPRLPAFQCTRSRTKQIRLCQQPSALSKQILTL